MEILIIYVLIFIVFILVIFLVDTTLKYKKLQKQVRTDYTNSLSYISEEKKIIQMKTEFHHPNINHDDSVKHCITIRMVKDLMDQKLIHIKKEPGKPPAGIIRATLWCIEPLNKN